ncbi:Retrovirus-related Pol polyprotein from transposon RE2 [Sesamum angolense]|uniref:Retrovirus-related Pol polyprotein from transposon RE2 n=1 Tax=Sesamum angolense TaxID=2727404 RepID=A0AAE1T5X7_9LAMI|nr:Retrovirus-related Pol polyprotein from transposon RE2 [Sesamum angolense]
MISPLLFAKRRIWRWTKRCLLSFRGGHGSCGPPPNADVVSCRWAFTLKFQADGTLERYKVVNLNWPMYKMDITNAFLYSDLNETVYIEQPPGYVAEGEKQRMVCKLNKAIYGLKQSPRAWFDKFRCIIDEFSFFARQAEHSVFVQPTRLGMVVLAVYVDDIMITGSDVVELKRPRHTYGSTSSLKIWGRPRYFLGIEIVHSKYGVFLSERKYACDLLQEVGLLDTILVDTPMDSNPNFWNDDRNYMEGKTKILKYTNASPGKGLLLKQHGHVKIEAYSNADYIGSKDDREV